MPDLPDKQLDIEELMDRIRKDVLRRQRQAPTSIPPEASRRYSLGTVLRFCVDGNAGPYLVRGWSHPEPEFQWTDGEAAELGVSLGNVPNDIVLSFKAAPMVGGDTEAQNVSAFCNGVLVGDWVIKEFGTYHTIVWSHIASASETMLVRFEMPGSFSQASRNLGADPRRLGLAFRELVFRPASELGFQ